MILRYQFNTDLYNADVVINILIKALTATPSPDFNLCVALLSERINHTNQDEPDHIPTLLPILSSLFRLLNECRFPAFWELFKDDSVAFLRENFFVEVMGFEDSIREVVIRAVRTTFTKIGKARLGNYLDLEGKLLNPSCFIHAYDWYLDGGLDEYIAAIGWTSTNGVVAIPPNPDNTIEATVVRESIKLPREFFSYNKVANSIMNHDRAGQVDQSCASCLVYFCIHQYRLIVSLKLRKKKFIGINIFLTHIVQSQESNDSSECP